MSLFLIRLKPQSFESFPAQLEGKPQSFMKLHLPITSSYLKIIFLLVTLAKVKWSYSFSREGILLSMCRVSVITLACFWWEELMPLAVLVTHRLMLQFLNIAVLHWLGGAEGPRFGSLCPSFWMGADETGVFSIRALRLPSVVLSLTVLCFCACVCVCTYVCLCVFSTLLLLF